MKHLLRISFGIALVIFLVHGCASPSVATSVHDPIQQETLAEVILPTQTCGDYFIVQAMIDGKGPFPMLLDTGAGTTVISASVSKEIDASKRLSSIKIGSFSATGSIPCKVKPVDHLSRALGMEIQGIMAYGVFEGVLLTYDFPNQQIRVRKGTFSEEEIAQPGVVNTSTGTRPFVRASVDDVDFTILLDTGSSSGLSIKKWNRFTFSAPPTATGASMRIDGLYISKSGRFANDMKLGPLTLARPVVKNSVSSNLAGQRIMRDFTVTFDQVKHKVRFSSAIGQLETPLEFPSLYGTGIASTPREDRLIVRNVFKDSAAHKAGVLVDDEILSIDGTAITERGCEHLEFKLETGPTPKDFLIQRKDEQMHIRFNTELLVE